MSASETASFTDPVFLATYGLNRVTILDYFLHPLNPFRIKTKSSNDILITTQAISIAFIMQNGIGMRPGPLSLTQAEEEFSSSLTRLIGHQYELAPVPNPNRIEALHSPLFTIRHVYRSSENKVTNMGIYYVLEGVIYKSPCARSLMKANVARTTKGLMEACNVLKHCARYSPRTGYYWDFERKSVKKINKINKGKGNGKGKGKSKGNVAIAAALAKGASISISESASASVEENSAALASSTTSTTAAGDDIEDIDDDDDDEEDIDDNEEEEGTESMQEILNDFKARSKMATSARRILDNRPAGERSEEEEEGIRAKEKMNSILLRLKGSIRTGAS